MSTAVTPQTANQLARVESEQRLLGEALRELAGKIDWIEAALVGSAYIIGPEKANDIDLLLLVRSVTLTGLLLEAAGYEAGGSNEPGPDDDYWLSLTRSDTRLNVILCECPDFFEKWKLAAEVCKYLRLEKKDDRVNVHRIIMDGYTADQVTAAQSLFEEPLDDFPF